VLVTGYSAVVFGDAGINVAIQGCYVLIFVLVVPRFAPGSTLFPYTTLFRSGASGRADPREGPRRRGPGASLPAHPRPHARPPGPDRKSTRLNSSHDQTSYAVFCLKKKKITIL